MTDAMIASTAVTIAAMTVLSDAKSGAGIGTGTVAIANTAVAIVATPMAITIRRMFSGSSFDNRKHCVGPSSFGVAAFFISYVKISRCPTNGLCSYCNA
ncbi:hypothetical protein [Pararhizobium sp. DWP3-4]|uniref:hypothetical protein n=1 Tax=unclassified Pararhizobium TaxID=2643050 RepID=UPI003CEAF0F0